MPLEPGSLKSLLFFLFWHFLKCTLPLTYCGVSHEGLPVGHHGVHSHLLEVLAGDDGDGRLLGGLHLRHLLHHGDLLLLGLDPGEAVQVVLQRLN